MAKSLVHRMSEVSDAINRNTRVGNRKHLSGKIETMRILARRIRDSIEPGSSPENSERRKLAGTIEDICFDVYGSIKKLEEAERD